MENQSDLSRYKRGPQKIVLKLKGKKAGLYVKNIYGTRAYGQRKILKASSLSREINLRSERRLVKDLTDELQRMGLLRWPEFKQEYANFIRLTRSIEGLVKTYKDRRLEAGMLYLTPCLDSRDIIVHSHLLRMPVKEALKRRRQDMKKRGEILAAYNNGAHRANTSGATTANEHGGVTLKTRKACTTSMLLYTIASIFIGCIIVLIPKNTV